MEQIIENQSMADYLAHPAIGSSTLKQILALSPKDYKYSLEKKVKETSAQSRGTLWHSFLIERDKYDEQYLMQPEDWGPLTTNPGKEKWTALKKTAAALGKTPVKYSDCQHLHLLDREIKNHQGLKSILCNYKPEVSFYSDFNGHIFKSRSDIWCPVIKEVWDVKTTSGMFKPGRGIEENLQRIILENRYHFQAAHHMMVMQLCGIEVDSWGWIWIATDTPAPHIIITRASKNLLASGLRDWQYAVNMLDDCEKTNEWVGYDDDISEIDLPSWSERFY